MEHPCFLGNMIIRYDGTGYAMVYDYGENSILMIFDAFSKYMGCDYVDADGKLIDTNSNLDSKMNGE